MISRHAIEISWSPADRVFIAKVPELPGCMADGATRLQALVNAERVIGEWIEAARAEGRSIPKPALA